MHNLLLPTAAVAVTLLHSYVVTRLRRYAFVFAQVPFLGPILTSLRRETEGKTSLIGFIGAPWTLVCAFFQPLICLFSAPHAPPGPWYAPLFSPCSLWPVYVPLISI